MDITVRKARPDDTASVIPLIYSAGPHEWDYVCTTGGRTSLGYLSYVFPRRLGPYSHRHYLVATVGGEVAGVGGSHYGRDMLLLDLGSYWSGLMVWGPRDVFKVAQRATELATVLPPPAKDAVYILSLAVTEQWRGQGIGSAIMRQMMEQARADGLRRCILDVAATNPRAQALYERFGFKVIEDLHWAVRRAPGAVPGQRRMEMTL